MPRRAASSPSNGPWRWLLATCIAAAGIAHGQDVDPEASVIWQKVRADLFAAKTIAPGDDVVALEVPARAQDGAVVPLTIRARFPQSAERSIDKVWLIVDNNPSPIAAVFQFTRLSGRADIETRIRVDQYTHVRAIAATNDGSLYMVSRYVKAAGGCSAPPGTDATAAKANLGKMRLALDKAQAPGQPALARLMISHPNDSGLAMDQVSRTYAPAHFVRLVEVRYAGELVLRADLDFTISENPSFRFYLLPADEAKLEVTVVDNKDLVFTSNIGIGVGRR
jgi:sulfur-oxidizing protein SoxY